MLDERSSTFKSLMKEKTNLNIIPDLPSRLDTSGLYKYSKVKQVYYQSSPELGGSFAVDLLYMLFNRLSTVLAIGRLRLVPNMTGP